MINHIDPIKHIRTRVWIISFFVVLGIYISAIINHNVAYIVFLISIGSLLFMTNEEMYTLSFFLLPFTMIFKASTTGSSLFTYLIIVVTCVAIMRKRNIRADVFLLTVILAVYLLFGMGSNITTYLKLLINVFFFYGFTINVRQKEFRSIVISLSIGTIISGVIGLQKQIVPAINSFFSVVKTEYINGAKTLRFSGLYLDPNYFSILIISCLFCLTVYMIKKELTLKFGLILSVPLVIFGCITLSKIFYISLVIGVLFLLGIYAKTSGKIINIFFIVFFLSGIALYFADKFGLIEQIVYRFSAEDISNNRINIWSDYWYYIQENVEVMLFGAGLNAGLIGGSGAHSFYIEMVYYLGIFGSAIYTVLYSILLFSKSLIIKRNFVNYSLLAIVLLMYATLGTLFMNDFVFILLMVWMMLNTEMKNDINGRAVSGCEGKWYEKNVEISKSIQKSQRVQSKLNTWG